MHTESIQVVPFLDLVVNLSLDLVLVSHLSVLHLQTAVRLVEFADAVNEVASVFMLVFLNLDFKV